MSTTYGATGLGARPPHRRGVVSSFFKRYCRFRSGVKNGANDRGNAPSCTALSDWELKDIGIAARPDRLRRLGIVLSTHEASDPNR